MGYWFVGVECGAQAFSERPPYLGIGCWPYFFPHTRDGKVVIGYLGWVIGLLGLW